MNFVGWLIWMVALFVLIAEMLIFSHPEKAIGNLAKRFSFFILIGLVLTAFTDISKFHIIWWIPFSYYINYFYFWASFKRKLKYIPKTIEQSVEPKSSELLETSHKDKSQFNFDSSEEEKSRYTEISESSLKEQEPKEELSSLIPFEIGRDVSWIDVVYKVFLVKDFDRSGTRIKGNRVLANSKTNPYGYLLVISPLYNKPLRLPIIHSDDFLLATSVFDDPKLIPMLTQKELLVTYAPKQYMPSGHALGYSHVLHYVFVPIGTLEYFYLSNNKDAISKQRMEQLFVKFNYTNKIKVQINLTP
ncbi:MAG: hypothetical protein RDU14_05240 [Melioribacteraceae bacterium]|nr:hypothetical protein [Melioribacteraceae bacterium]